MNCGRADFGDFGTPATDTLEIQMEGKIAPMDRREFLLSAAASTIPLDGASRKPNFVFILADDLGYGDLSSYGAPDCDTPNIDRIGDQGIRFTRAYANAPECSPTRCAFMTGSYQQRVGGLECAIGTGNVGRYDEAEWLAQKGELGLPPEEISIAQILKKAGYETCLSGKWHLGYDPKHSPKQHGFDESFGILGGNADYFTHCENGGRHVLFHNEMETKREGYLTDLITDHAVQWLSRRDSQPFFLYVPFTAPHSPYQAPGDSKIVTRKTWNDGDRATFVSMTQSMDIGVGRILVQLEQSDLSRNTLVVFMSDNGGTTFSSNAPFRGSKATLWEGGIRVPCLARWPGMIPEQTTSESAVCTMDWTATMVNAAGMAERAGRRFDGIDLAPYLQGQSKERSSPLFFRYKRGNTRRWAVIDGNMKFVRNGVAESVYDLAADPGEANSILSDDQETAGTLRKKLADWELEVRAPRLQGFTKEQ